LTVSDQVPGVTGELSVRLLGPLEVSVDGRPVVLTAPRLRTLLAVLATSAGKTVSVDRLAMAAWGEELPADARRALQTYVTRLRGILGAQHVGTSPDGYALHVEPDRVDALRFLRLLDAAAVAPDTVGKRALLAQALGLWRGVPFEGVRSAWLADAEGRRLVERYLAATERRVDLDLAEGRATELVAELSELTARFPLRESLWARLLVALDRCGRQAEALERYEAVRVRLAEELGADPGPELQRVHADLLAGRPLAPAPASAPPLAPARDAVREAPVPVVPRQLPADVDGFTGREQELVELERGLVDADRHGTVVISAIQGTGGVGKSALAIRAAHRVAERFPDGQLYVNLQGATVGLAPLGPLEVLGRFLRALGVDPVAIPGGVEEAAALYRSRLAGKRVLVVLDDAADAAQVRPLLPAAPGCGVLVTSRRVLASLEGAHHLQLDVLAPAEATELLGRVAGDERVAAEPQPAAEVARLCGYLPLAVRIAGARLAARPTWPVKVLAERLADAQRRLDELELAEVGVRASFTVSYQQLHTSGDSVDRAAAEAFGLLGLLDGPELGIPVVTRLLDAPEKAVERVLERLVDAQLLETPHPGRYRLHDLLRSYARELAGQQHPEPERAAALTRALGFYAASAWQTLELLRPGDYRLARAGQRWRTGGLRFTDAQAALAWLEAERANLLAAIAQAATTPGVPAELAVQLTHALLGFFQLRSHWQDCEQANRTALGVARRLGDRAAQAQVQSDLGIVHERLGRYQKALDRHRESLALRRELGDRYGQAASLGSLGLIYQQQGDHVQALAFLQESLALRQELGDRRGQAASLSNLGMVYQRQERYKQALASLRESLAIHRELGDRHGQAHSLADLGPVHEQLGRHAQALACLQESLVIHRDLGGRACEAHSLHNFGVVYQRQGRFEQALACLRESLGLYRELDLSHGQAESLRELGVTLRALGRAGEARAHWLEALAIFERLQTADADQVRALLAELPAAPAPPGRRAMKAL
jgi:DNA-binding SARP family transcriptional activator/tetratricopeptide (TPR) repeat protein